MGQFGEFRVPGKLAQYLSHKQQACDIDRERQVLGAQIDKPAEQCRPNWAAEMAIGERALSTLNQYRSAGRLFRSHADLPRDVSRDRNPSARILVTKVSDARKIESVISGVSAAVLLHSRFFDAR
jgi:hypothetical protein